MISDEDYEHSRVMFWKLIGVGDELQHAMEWRAQYLRDHDMILCRRCGVSKPVDAFYLIHQQTFFAGYSLPCKECKARGRKEKAQEKRS